MADQPGQHATMVEMGMGEDDRVKLARVKGERLVVQRLQSPRSLEQAAIDKDAMVPSAMRQWAAASREIMPSGRPAASQTGRSAVPSVAIIPRAMSSPSAG